MKNKMLKRSAAFMAMFIAIIMCLFALAPIVACSGKETEKDVGTISLDKTSLTLYIGDVETLTPTLSNSESRVTWKSSDTSVATVAAGKVTAKQAGTATITASLSEDVKATCTVTVNDVDISLDKTTASIDLEGSSNKTLKLTATLSHGTAQWKSSNSEVATVAADGTVTFLKAKAASTTVTITAYVGSKEASCEITVTDSTLPADYYALSKNTSKAGLPVDDWQYFLKSAHADRVEFAADPVGATGPYFANGALHFDMVKLSTVEGDNTQYEFRYIPRDKAGLAENDTFTLSLTINTNVSGTVHVVKAGGGDENVEVVAGEPNQFVFEGCVANSEPIAIWPQIFELAEDGTFQFAVSDIVITKTGAVEVTPPEGETPEVVVYDLGKANNGEKAITDHYGKWSYYIQNETSDGAFVGAVLKSATYNDGTVTVTMSNITSHATTQYFQRIYFANTEEVGTQIKVVLTVSLSVDGIIVVDGGGGTAVEVELTAGETKQIEYTYTVLDASAKDPLRVRPVIADLEAAAGDVTITISNVNFTTVEA